jgi:hypothetical protein
VSSLSFFVCDAVIPAKAGIQGVNDIARIMRDLDNLDVSLSAMMNG